MTGEADDGEGEPLATVHPLVPNRHRPTYAEVAFAPWLLTAEDEGVIADLLGIDPP